MKNIRPWEHTPTLFKKDIERLTPIASSGKTLIAELSKHAIGLDDLKRIVLMEFTNRAFPRQYMLDRCFSRISKLDRQRAERALHATQKSNARKRD